MAIIRSYATARARLAFVAISFLGLMTVLAGPVQAQLNMGGHQSKDEGQRIYEKANCVGCHKWHGGGGGGYGGPALSLRDTTLDRDALIEVVRCGRPGAGMPYHDRDAYKKDECYGGLTAKELSSDMPMEAAHFLRPQEIEAVVDYVLHHIKGKGPPTYQDCIDFFGDGARACNVYRAQGATEPGQAATAGK